MAFDLKQPQHRAIGFLHRDVHHEQASHCSATPSSDVCLVSSISALFAGLVDRLQQALLTCPPSLANLFGHYLYRSRHSLLRGMHSLSSSEQTLCLSQHTSLSFGADIHTLSLLFGSRHSLSLFRSTHLFLSSVLEQALSPLEQALSPFRSTHSLSLPEQTLSVFRSMHLPLRSRHTHTLSSL